MSRHNKALIFLTNNNNYIFFQWLGIYNLEDKNVKEASSQTLGNIVWS